MVGVACLLRGARTRNLVGIATEGLYAAGALRLHSELTHLKTSQNKHTSREGRMRSTDAKQETTMSGRRQVPNPHMTEVLFVEVGFGCDGHGQDVTKAATRACRNAIEFNSLPAMGRLIPSGYAGMRLHIKIGTPHPERIDVERCKEIFPYGLPIVEVVQGGLSCGSGIAVEELGDTGDEMCIAVAAVTVGYGEPSS